MGLVVIITNSRLYAIYEIKPLLNGTLIKKLIVAGGRDRGMTALVCGGPDRERMKECRHAK